MKKILVADDHLEILEVVTEVLSYEAFEVKGLSSGNDVISVVKEFKPNLVLLDLKMGEADGAVLCRQIKPSPGLQIPLSLSILPMCPMRLSRRNMAVMQ